MLQHFFEELHYTVPIINCIYVKDIFFNSINQTVPFIAAMVGNGNVNNLNSNSENPFKVVFTSSIGAFRSKSRSRPLE